ncbi:uncharacterized protein K460DRAFT_9624 [Cucurbitaria berberidis CBS 394.84]|uniref:Uncharacterized protein n=1 Tax=Cucurbitaria berberidis CBS 394.84 TaxID=1168544 RepID=A0A9P4GRK2_9PLEO|nr:uncharacterized protein K460DRAFT_9624 [Cucurbitaria berberidis CBS 394.84]KAF1850032.1 hypothetical protein K460DRAFT_9624 [Cucurbitaria berberidis CBS 394.84]
MDLDTKHSLSLYLHTYQLGAFPSSAPSLDSVYAVFRPLSEPIVEMGKTKGFFFQVYKRQQKTYNSGDSLVVTHLTTNPPVSCLSTAERTGSAEFKILWSYVEE